MFNRLWHAVRVSSKPRMMRFACGSVSALSPTRTTVLAALSLPASSLSSICSISNTSATIPRCHCHSAVAHHPFSTPKHNLDILSKWPAQHASLRSQPHLTPCARRFKAHNQPTRLQSTLRPTKHITIRRHGLSCPRRHGSPSAILPTRRTTISQSPSRVFELEFPTALSHVDRPTADADTIRRSLLATTRSISTRAPCKKRKSRTRPSWMATSTRYVKEHVTQEQDWRWTPRAVGSPVDAQCMRTDFRVLQAAAAARSRLGYLDQPRRHATAVRTQGQMLWMCC